MRTQYQVSSQLQLQSSLETSEQPQGCHHRLPYNCNTEYSAKEALLQDLLCISGQQAHLPDEDPVSGFSQPQPLFLSSMRVPGGSGKSP